VKTRDVDAVSALENSSRAAFYGIHRRLDGIEETMMTDSQRLSRVEASNKALVLSNQQLVAQNSSILSLLQEMNGRRPAAAPAPEGEFCFWNDISCFVIFV
jgi:hypothetical protein